MKHTILIFAMLCCTSYVMAQSKNFEEKAAIIASRIDSITTAEKSTLKKELKKLDKKVEKNEMTSEAAEVEKKRLASYHAKRINKAVFIEEQKLQALIKDKVSGQQEVEKEDIPIFTSLSKENYYQDSISGIKIEKRFTTQFVIAFGMHTALNDDGGYYGDGFKVNPLGFGEVGFTFKYRLKETTNLWNLKFGFSIYSDEIKPEHDNAILVINNDETTLQDAGFKIDKSRFTNMYVSLPVHLELDFSKPQYHGKTEQSYLRSQRGFRMGLGGYLGVRIYTQQFMKFDDENGLRTTLNQQDRFNMNNISFGPSAYVGYRDLSLYAKYSVSPTFKNNPQDINTLSIGLRLDLN